MPCSVFGLYNLLMGIVLRDPLLTPALGEVLPSLAPLRYKGSASVSQTQLHQKIIKKNLLTRHACCVIVIKVLRTMPKTVGAEKRNE